MDPVDPGPHREMARLAHAADRCREVLPVQIDWFGVVLKAYPSNQALRPMESYVVQFMRSRYEQFESGAAGLDFSAVVATIRGQKS